jgi:DNA-binding transcriptional MocR family regulator
MRLNLNKTLRTPLYLQIFDQLRRQILTGELPPGFRLPPERKLADSLGVNRTTVVNAYRELKAEGLVDSRVGDGTVVLASQAQSQDLDSHPAQEPVWGQLFSRMAGQFENNPLKDLRTQSSQREVISFAPGVSNPAHSPLEILNELEHETLEKRNLKALLQSPPEGFLSLRHSLAGLMQSRGVFCPPEQLLLLSGSQQGLDLISRTLIDPGDVVLVEEPSYFPALQAFRAAGARVLGVPVDAQGLQVQHLEAYLQRYRPKFIYCMPSFQNPSGAEMGLERRKHLLALALKYRTLLVEDDAYGELCYQGSPLPSLKALDQHGYVIYLSTFSKTLCPGLRLGWLTAHPRLVSRLAAVKQSMDLHPSSLSQFLVERFITRGDFNQHLARLNQIFAQKRETILAALQEYAPPELTWNKPRGGYYLWCRLPSGLSSTRFFNKAAEQHVLVMPGAPFFSAEPPYDAFRLNFTYPAQTDIEEGVKRLCKTLKLLLHSAQPAIPQPIPEDEPVLW